MILQTHRIHGFFVNVLGDSFPDQAGGVPYSEFLD